MNIDKNKYFSFIYKRPIKKCNAAADFNIKFLCFTLYKDVFLVLVTMDNLASCYFINTPKLHRKSRKNLKPVLKK